MTHPIQLDASCLQNCMVGTALDGMCVGMVVTSPGGRVAWMNRSAQRLLGVAKKESHGEPLGALLRDPQMAEFWHAAKAADEAKLGAVSVHWPKACELKVNSSRCVDSDGECIGRVLILCDVTQEHMLRIELSQQASQRLTEMAAHWQGTPEGEPHAGLTPQELRILRMVGNGFGNEEIARAIEVAPSTVRTHLKHVYAKVGLSSRSEAISYAIHAGLT
jgi:DNA-binding CsgD family transcriptional regulator